MNERIPTRIAIRKTITATAMVSFIVVGCVDALAHGEATYSSIMGMDIAHVYFYTFFLLVIGCWLLFHRFFTGIGFIALATFSSYFLEYVSLHNYFASIVVYVGLLLDIFLARKYRWFIPFIAFGAIQGIAFRSIAYSNYVVGGMEFLSLCVGTVFLVKNVE